MKRKVCMLITAVAMLACSVSANAVQYPNSFWGLDSKYQEAVKAKNYSEIINLGKQELELMKTLPYDKDLCGAIGTRAIAVANAYEALGQYENSVEYHRKYAECAAVMGWDDGVRVSTAKANAFTTSLDLYTLTDSPVKYYGAKLEPQTGTYFGQVYEASDARDSMIIIYQEYGQSYMLNWLNRALTEARAANKAVELALNFPQYGSQLDSIINDTAFLADFCTLLSNYKDVRIFLRIGAEMNVWQDLPDAEKFKRAFIKIASDVRRVNNNIAIVWSVAHTSTNGVEMNDFYPGDEYVDWVGISAYGVKYFQGKRWDDNINEIYFKAGDGAEPTKLVEEVVTKYGSRKPIMIAEGGSARETYGSVNESHTEWARLNMMRFYSTLMMKYPQIKLIGYFNKRMNGETQCYEINSVPELKNAYTAVTSMPWFIQNGQSAAKSFKQIDGVIETSDSLEIYALPYVFKDQQPRVDYRIDGKWVGATVYLPYGAVLDLSGLSDGDHTLEAVVTSGGTERIKRTYTLRKNASSSSGSGSATESGSAAAGEFNDTAALNNSQKNALKFAAEKGIIDGYDDGSFKPENRLTRAEFAAMVCRAYGYKTGGQSGFSDMIGHWADGYVKACTNAGAIDGVGDNKFSPDSCVLMEHASKILTVCGGFTDGEGVIYPNGYIKTANDNKLYLNTSFYPSDSESIFERLIEVRGTELSRIDAAVMFYNAAGGKF